MVKKADIYIYSIDLKTRINGVSFIPYLAEASSLMQHRFIFLLLGYHQSEKIPLNRNFLPLSLYDNLIKNINSFSFLEQNILSHCFYFLLFVYIYIF